MLSIDTFAQETPKQEVLSSPSNSDAQEVSRAPASVDVQPIAHDQEIAERLQKVLEATGWFTNPKVEVKEGIVFLSGSARTEELKKWAENLALNTQDVIAVVNRIKLPRSSFWDFNPMWKSMLTLWGDFIRLLPFLIFALFILALSVGGSILSTRAFKALFRKRIKAKLLTNVMARAAVGIVFLFGIYIVLRVAGLTQLALTLVGGTGLIGLAVGIAFRSITENFLASIFLSIQQPFKTGDLVEIVDITGYVQQLNVRTTILTTLDGNIVQIPNSTVYQSNIRNFTTSASRCENFDVGIGYDDSISQAQEIALKVLQEHPAVLKDPEPSVLVQSLGNATVILRVYFWFNGKEYSWLKVRSSVIRLVKIAFQNNEISMPDEAREVVFPQGIPITLLERKTEKHLENSLEKRVPSRRPPEKTEAASTQAEAGLYSEAATLKQQASESQSLKEEENLLQR